MSKIPLIMRREYLTRVTRPSFWVLSILMPLLLAALYAVPVLMALRPAEKARVVVADDTRLFASSFRSGDAVAYTTAPSLAAAEAMLRGSDSLSAIVYIPGRETTIPADAFLYYRKDKPSIDVQADVDRQLQEILRNSILLDVHNISAEDYALITGTRITLHAKDLETGRDGYLMVKSVTGMVLAVLVFVVIMAFGAQVQRGVMEEKGSRIAEVVISSVKPFELMMGKVTGICAVGLTQIALWLLIGAAAVGAVQAASPALFEAAREAGAVTEVATKGTAATVQMQEALQGGGPGELMEGLAGIRFGVLAAAFLFYFLFGYLLYASLFAAVGAVTDPDTDGSQFTLPLTAPLLLTLMLGAGMMRAPGGALATWLSIVPFTSPVAMLLRIPFGVPYWQLALSAALLAAFFPLCTWVAARVYRRGILLYGTRVTYRMLGRWMRGR